MEGTLNRRREYEEIEKASSWPLCRDHSSLAAENGTPMVGTWRPYDYDWTDPKDRVLVDGGDCCAVASLLVRYSGVQTIRAEKDWIVVQQSGSAVERE